MTENNKIPQEKILKYLEKELLEIQRGITILKNKEFNLIKMINEFRWEKR